jgi:hypothetical protein
MKNQKTILVTTIILIMSTLISFSCLPPTQAATTDFGYKTPGTAGTSSLNNAQGSLFTAPATGTANSISAYIKYTPNPSSAAFGQFSLTTTSPITMQNTVRLSTFRCTELAIATSISANMYVQTTTSLNFKVKVAIYDAATGKFMATSDENTFTTGVNRQYSISLNSQPVLLPNTDYTLAIWSNAISGKTSNIYHSPAASTPGRYFYYSYTGNWPTYLPSSTAEGTTSYLLGCSYYKAVTVGAAIYSTSGELIGKTQEKTLPDLTTAYPYTTDGWFTFNFDANNKPQVTKDSGYVLAAWATSPTISTPATMPYNVGADEYYSASGTYPTWPSIVDQNSKRTHSIYANINVLPTVQSCDPSGTKKDTFSTSEPVTAKASNLQATTTYPIYLVQDVVTWGDGNIIPTRVAGSITSITSDNTGTVNPIAIWTSPMPGQYDIIIDVNSNGKYDASIDAIDNNEIVTTAGLFVVPEYALGGLFALAACFMGFIAFKKRSSIPQLFHR